MSIIVFLHKHLNMQTTLLSQLGHYVHPPPGDDASDDDGTSVVRLSIRISVEAS